MARLEMKNFNKKWQNISIITQKIDKYEYLAVEQIVPFN